jgi:hypothetical protein
MSMKQMKKITTSQRICSFHGQDEWFTPLDLIRGQTINANRLRRPQTELHSLSSTANASFLTSQTVTKTALHIQRKACGGSNPVSKSAL